MLSFTITWAWITIIKHSNKVNEAKSVYFFPGSFCQLSSPSTTHQRWKPDTISHFQTSWQHARHHNRLKTPSGASVPKIHLVTEDTSPIDKLKYQKVTDTVLQRILFHQPLFISELLTHPWKHPSCPPETSHNEESQSRRAPQPNIDREMFTPSPQPTKTSEDNPFLTDNLYSSHSEGWEYANSPWAKVPVRGV